MLINVDSNSSLNGVEHARLVQIAKHAQDEGFQDAMIKANGYHLYASLREQFNRLNVGNKQRLWDINKDKCDLQPGAKPSNYTSEKETPRSRFRSPSPTRQAPKVPKSPAMKQNPKRGSVQNPPGELFARKTTETSVAKSKGAVNRSEANGRERKENSENKSAHSSASKVAKTTDRVYHIGPRGVQQNLQPQSIHAPPVKSVDVPRCGPRREDLAQWILQAANMIHSHSPIVQHKGDKSGHSSSLIETLEEAVDDFKACVDEWKPPRKRDKWLSALGLGSSPESETFTSKYHKFEKTLENVKLLIAVEIL